MSAQKYRKKPVEIDAWQFTGAPKNATLIVQWVLDGGGTARWHEHVDAAEYDDGKGHPADPEHLSIDALEGTMRADLGDWIIRGVKGEFYPCKNEIFLATYDQVAEDEGVQGLRQEEAP